MNSLQFASLALAPKGRTDSQEGRWRAQEKSIDDWLPINARRNAKWWYSAFHNVTAMVGAGVLSLPYAMSELGWSVPLTTFLIQRKKKQISIFHSSLCKVNALCHDMVISSVSYLTRRVKTLN